MTKKIVRISGLSFLFACIGAALFAQTVADRGKAMLQKADRLFSPEECSGFISVESTMEDGRILNEEMEFYKKGPKKQTVVWVSPKSERNDVGLRNERTIYHKPVKAHKPFIYGYLTIFLESAFSWGDIISVDFSYDYRVESITTKEEADGRTCSVLVLKPTGKDMYDRIDVWLDDETGMTWKRIYYTASGDLMKTAEYGDFEWKGGRISGCTLTMKDETIGLTSVAVFSEMKAGKIPDFMFDPNNIGRIHASR